MAIWGYSVCDITLPVTQRDVWECGDTVCVISHFQSLSVMYGDMGIQCVISHFQLLGSSIHGVIQSCSVMCGDTSLCDHTPAWYRQLDPQSDPVMQHDVWAYKFCDHVRAW